MSIFLKLLRELLVLIPLYLLCFGLAWFVLSDHVLGNSEGQIMLEGRMFVLNHVNLSMVIFVPMVCVIYGVRFLFFRPRQIHTGIVLISYMFCAHFLIWFYGPIYSAARLILGDGENVIFRQADNEPFSVESADAMMSALRAYEESIRQELVWIQLAVGLFTLLFVILLIFTIVKGQKNKQSNHEIPKI